MHNSPTERKRDSPFYQTPPSDRAPLAASQSDVSGDHEPPRNPLTPSNQPGHSCALTNESRSPLQLPADDERSQSAPNPPESRRTLTSLSRVVGDRSQSCVDQSGFSCLPAQTIEPKDSLHTPGRPIDPNATQPFESIGSILSGGTESQEKQGLRGTDVFHREARPVSPPAEVDKPQTKQPAEPTLGNTSQPGPGTQHLQGPEVNGDCLNIAEIAETCECDRPTMADPCDGISPPIVGEDTLQDRDLHPSKLDDAIEDDGEVIGPVEDTQGINVIESVEPHSPPLRAGRGTSEKKQGTPNTVGLTAAASVVDHSSRASSVGSRKRKRSFDELLAEEEQMSRSGATARSPRRSTQTPRLDPAGREDKEAHFSSSSLTPLSSSVPRPSQITIRDSQSPSDDDVVIVDAPEPPATHRYRDDDWDEFEKLCPDLLVLSQREQKPDTASPPGERRRSGNRSSHVPVKNEPKLKMQPPPSYKFSLKKLTNQNERDSNAQEKIAAYRSEMETATSDETRDREGSMLGTKMDESVLASVVGQEGDEGHVSKVFQAMERTEVLKMENAWYFFDFNAPPGEMRCPAFPDRKDTGAWSSRLSDTTFRDHVFLTGCARELTTACDLPEEILSWLWDAAINDPREELSLRYIEVMSASRAFQQDPLSTNDLRLVFERCGARPDTLSTSAKIPSAQRRKNASNMATLPPMARIVKALDQFSDVLSPETVQYAIHMLLRLSLDSTVSQTSDLKLSISHTISTLFRRLSTESHSAVLQLARDLVSTISPPTLAHCLVNTIPASYPPLHLFKRRLALAFFLSNPETVESDLANAPKLTSQIVSKLRGDPAFDVNADIDYRNLTALISLLDVAVAGGFDPPPHLPLGRRRSLEARDREEAFNENVDRVSAELTTLFTRIVDTGASHMTRTTAKGVLERLKYRLDYAVRTRPKPKMDVYGSVMERRSGVGVGGAQEQLMRGFVKKEKREEGDPGPRPRSQEAEPDVDMDKGQERMTGTERGDAASIADADEADADADAKNARPGAQAKPLPAWLAVRLQGKADKLPDAGGSPAGARRRPDWARSRGAPGEGGPRPRPAWAVSGSQAGG